MLRATLLSAPTLMLRGGCLPLLLTGRLLLTLLTGRLLLTLLTGRLLLTLLIPPSARVPSPGWKRCISCDVDSFVRATGREGAGAPPAGGGGLPGLPSGGSGLLPGSAGLPPGGAGLLGRSGTVVLDVLGGGGRLGLASSAAL